MPLLLALWHLLFFSPQGIPLGSSVMPHAGGGGPVTVTQAGQCESGGFSCNFSLTLTGGQTVYIAAVGSTGGSATITIGNGNVCTTANASHTGASGVAISCYVASDVAGAATITCASSLSIDFQGCTAIEFANAATLDQVAVTDDVSTTTHTAGSITTATTGIVLGWFGCAKNQAGTWTPNAPFTIPTNGSQTGAGGYAVQYKVSTAGTYTPVADTTLGCASVNFTASFK